LTAAVPDTQSMQRRGDHAPVLLGGCERVALSSLCCGVSHRRASFNEADCGNAVVESGESVLRLACKAELRSCSQPSA
jgi:hypothetical protein